jgi:hypothetical protein
MLFIEENSVAAPQRTTDQSPCVLLISGSCASGKSTISHLIASTYGAVQIDGDWMLQLRKIELGEKPDFNDIHMDMLTMAQGFASMGKDVVVAHVILPEALPLYESFLKQKRIRYLFVVLMPGESDLLARSQERKCWPEPTPKYWVYKFNNDLIAGSEHFRKAFYDNTSESPDETASCLWNKLQSIRESHPKIEHYRGDFEMNR